MNIRYYVKKLVNYIKVATPYHKLDVLVYPLLVMISKIINKDIFVLIGTLQLWHIFEPFMLHLRPNSCETFIDVGAHVGGFTIPMAKKCKRVIAIEPHPENFRILIQNCLRKGVLKKVRAINVALSDRDDVDNLYIAPNSGAHTLLKLGNRSIKCKIRKLDSLMEQLMLDSIDYIKIDVQGAEFEVLKGSVKVLASFRPKIIVEAHDETYSQVEKILRTFGYEIKYLDCRRNEYIIFAYPSRALNKNLRFSL